MVRIHSGVPVFYQLAASAPSKLILALLKQLDGATLEQLMKTTGWQAHSVRGFLSILGKKKGLAVESTKSAEGERTYRIK